MVRMMDDFCRVNLPVIEDLPQFIFDVLRMRFPRSLNCVAAFLDAAVDGHHWGDCVAIRTESDMMWTYRALRDASNRAANTQVHDGGLAPDSRVLLHGTNRPLLPVAWWFGAVKAGWGGCRDDAVAAHGRVVRGHRTREGVPCPLRDRAVVGTRVRTRGAARRRPCADIRDRRSGPPQRWGSDYSTSSAVLMTCAYDPCVIAFTSGTTGQPKTTVHFHRDVMAVYRCFPEYVLKLTADSCLPWLLLFPVSVGTGVVLLLKTALSQLLSAVAAHRVSILFSTPPAMRFRRRYATHGDSALAST